MPPRSSASAPAPCAAGAGGSSRLAMTGCSIAAAASPPPSAPPWPRCSACSRSTAPATRASTSATSTSSPAASTAWRSAMPSSRRPCRPPAWSASIARGGAIAAGASRARASVSCSISTAAAIAGCPPSPTAGSRSSPSSTTPPSGCSTPSSGTAARASRPSLTARRAVIARYGLPMALYTDRASWACHTPTSGTGPDRRRLTQVGRALARLGIEHILGFSPQARGRSERVNRTLHDRLVNEYRLAGITTLAAANRYLRDRFLPAFNAEFGRPPADPAPAFVPLGAVDLDQILCVEEERVVGRDNVVTTERAALPLAKPPGRRSCAGLRVLVRRHLSGHHSVWYGARCFGHYDPHGRPCQRPVA